MDTELTKDAEYMLCSIYKAYMEKRKDQISKAAAKQIGGAHEIHEKLMSQWSFEDVDETCRELDRAGFLNCSYYDNITLSAALTDKALIYMENRFTNGLTGVLEYMAKIRSALFF